MLLASSLSVAQKMWANASISMIRMYQRIAPGSVRDRCRFTPSCSEYAILAIGQYGFFKGWKLSILRFLRCRPPNGGLDFP